MVAYLEKCGKEWFDDYVYTANQPLVRRGIEIKSFDGTFLDDFVNRTVFEEDDIVVGSVEATIAFWKELGITPPAYIGYPGELKEFYDRNIYSTTFASLKDAKFPIFIKPKNDVKLFTGFVIESIDKLKDIQLLYPEITDDLELYASETFNIDSEYRFFIHKGECVGMRYYDGDWTVFPGDDVFIFINDIIKKYKDAPISYTLDIAVTNDITTKHRLIEINDFWAIGGYGLSGKIYTRMLIDRFQEIKNKQ